MKIHEIAAHTYKQSKRVGRGIGSGRGKTATRGTKGQNSRTGGGVKPGFEGGQTKFSMRMPKARGFTAKNKIRYQIVLTDALENTATTTLDKAALYKDGVISNKTRPVKLLLGNEKLTKKITLTIDKASKSAQAAVEKAGGKVILVESHNNASDAKKATNKEMTKTAVKTTAPKS